MSSLPDTPFAAAFRRLLAEHNITAPRFAHGSRAFDAAKPSCLYSGPVYGADEMVAATAALVEGRWSVAGEHVQRFERLFSQYLGQAASVAVNSGSSADLLMLAAAKARFGWADGDGVIVSPVGFPTTVSAITLNGLRPVFTDIEWSTLNADNDAIEAVLKGYPEDQRRQKAALSWIGDFTTTISPEGVKQTSWNAAGGPKTTFYPTRPTIRAILVSPVLGNPPDMDRLVELSTRYEVKLLLDGCDSLGTTWRGQHLASYAAASSCSFFPAHHISTLQGGMVTSNDTELVAIARSMGSWGKSCYCSGAGNLLSNGCCGKRFSAWLLDQPDLIVDHRYVFTTDRAYNTQMTEIQGALGCVQMGKLATIHEARRNAWARLHAIMYHLAGDMVTATNLADADPSWFGYPIICPTQAYKEALIRHLEGAGIQTRHAFGGHILRQPGYQHLGDAAAYPNADQVLRRVFFLGTNPLWSAEHFAHIEATIKAFVPPAAT